MTVVCCGVGADTGNVRPVPTVDERGRFEYVPIPEKGPTTASATYGSRPRRYAGGTLADGLDAVRPGSSGDWVTDPDAVAATAIHVDPNFAALTYGEHRPGYVAALRDLAPGDVVAFYTGLADPATDEKHRFLVGAFTVAAEPTVLPPDLDTETVRQRLAAHPENAHARRFEGNGALYYHDPAFTDRRETVVVVDGREPGGLFDRAVRLSDRRTGPNYYMDEAVAEVLRPTRRTDTGVHLGGFKPAVTCDLAREAFFEFVAERGAWG